MNQRTELVTPPAVEPVTLAEAKAFLRLEITDDDSLVTSLITVARQRCETMLRRAFITQTWDVFLDGWPYGGGYYYRDIRSMMRGATGWPYSGGGMGIPNWLPLGGGVPIEIPRPKLQSVSTITYLDSAGKSQILDPTQYTLHSGTPGTIRPAINATWPSTFPTFEAVTIRVVVGYGDTGASVPECVKLGIKLLVSHYYENRDLFLTASTGMQVPDGIAGVLAPEEWGAYG